MVTTIETEARILAVYEEVIESLRKVRIALSMHTDVFANARVILKEQRKWPKHLFRNLTDVVNTQAGNMLTQAGKLGKVEVLDKMAAKHLENLAEKIKVWHDEVMRGDVITKPLAAWEQFAGPTLTNFLEMIREDLVKLAVEDKPNKQIYIDLNKQVNDKFNEFRGETFKEIHAGV